MAAKESKTKIFFVELGKKKVKYAWRAAADAYKGIADALGVKEAADTDDGLIFGGRPKPPKVRLSLANKTSVIRFCDPGKIEELTIDGTLNNKKYDGQNINSVSVAS